MKELVFATNNAHKVAEIAARLDGAFHILTLREMECEEELPEEQETLEGNALQKAQYIWDAYGRNCFADDTGLEIPALNGEPGVYSARYAGPEKNSEANMNKVLSKLNNISDRTARFRTSIALIIEGKARFFEGEVQGHILTDRQGGAGFGYDPIFQPVGASRSFAEMSTEEKNALSHRGKAVDQLVAYLKNLPR